MPSTMPQSIAAAGDDSVNVIGDLERAFAAAIFPNRGAIAIVSIVVIAGIALVALWRRWDRPVRRHPRATGLILGIVLAVTIPVGWYLASPLFLSTTVDEPPPVAAVEPSPTPQASASDEPSASPEPAMSASPSQSPVPTPAALIQRVGSFTGADDFHFGRGAARLIETSPGAFAVRLEGFAVRNGPDLYVYLSPATDGYADGAIQLGRLKADRGNQNYAVPAGVDVNRVASVVIWCKQFSVLFATAPLS